MSRRPEAARSRPQQRLNREPPAVLSHLRQLDLDLIFALQPSLPAGPLHSGDTSMRARKTDKQDNLINIATISTRLRHHAPSAIV